MAGDNGATVVGANGTYTINDQFDPNVLTAFQDLISLAKDAGQIVVQTQQQANATNAEALKQTNATSAAALSAVSGAYNNQQLGTTQVFQNMIPLIIVAGVVIVIFMSLRRK